MIPASFDYSSPKSVAEAISLLKQHGSGAKILAGGQSLIPLMKLRLAAPKHLIDLNGITDLSYIRESDGHLAIGAMTRESELDSSDLIKKKYPIIADTASVIGDPLVRNRATVGGNLAHADPANDHPATMLALDTNVIATGPKGRRTIPISEDPIGSILFVGRTPWTRSPAVSSHMCVGRKSVRGTQIEPGTSRRKERKQPQMEKVCNAFTAMLAAAARHAALEQVVDFSGDARLAEMPVDPTL